MKRLAIIFFVLIFLGGGVFPSIQAEDKTDKAKALDDLGKFSRDVGLSILGYDLQCVHAIEEMEKEGKLSHGQAQYLINRECKKNGSAATTRPTLSRPFTQFDLSNLRRNRNAEYRIQWNLLYLPKRACLEISQM